MTGRTTASYVGTDMEIYKEDFPTVGTCFKSGTGVWVGILSESDCIIIGEQCWDCN